MAFIIDIRRQNMLEHLDVQGDHRDVRGSRRFPVAAVLAPAVRTASVG